MGGVVACFFFLQIKSWAEIVAYKNDNSNNKYRFDWFSNNVYDRVYILLNQ